ncbi:MAG: helix-hairpin-helix domain-containing protein, partial [Desulfobacteraceae bacterium]|nr:helix-hairpin-helix domain-containing protein [Desulfobacteraceae bacterium]
MDKSNVSEILLLLNNVKNSDELIGMFSHIENFEISTAFADQIIEYRNSLAGNRIKMLSDILNIDNIPNQFKNNIEQLIDDNKIHSVDYPFLLLPLKLETRFIDNKLWIRIYPDQIFLNTHIPGITENEYNAGIKFSDDKRALEENDDIEPEEKETGMKNAWRECASALGSERASYVLSYIKYNGKPDEFHVDKNDFITETNLQAIPRRFIVYTFREGELIYKKLGNIIPADLDVIKGNSENEDLFTSSTHWIINKEEAEKNGMAICIENLTHEDRSQGFEKIIVVGIRGPDPDSEEETLRNLINNHHYSSGISFCELYTPTNNTGDLKSGHSESYDDYEETYDIEIKGPDDFNNPNALHRHNANLLGKALGFDDDLNIFRYLQNSGDKTLDYARQMNTCIWPGTGKFFLTDLLNNTTEESTINDIEDHFNQFVRALGHFPSLRIDTQPYGILPVTSILPNSPDNMYGWKHSSKDIIKNKNWESFDTGLHAILMNFFELWKNLSNNQNRIPRMAHSSDPDQSLISILSMEPVSYKINARPILSDKFQSWIIGAFRDYYFGEGTAFEGMNDPEFWAGQWYNTSQSTKDAIAEYFSELTGLNQGQIRSSKLFRLFAWNKADEIDIDFDYFSRLSLLLTHDQPEEQGKIKRAINFLKNISAMEFLNAENDPKAIVKRIVDDPYFRKKAPKAYGIREKIAEKILEFRNCKEKKQLETIIELLSIEGLGHDTLHDIIFSFKNIDIPILLKFFNTVSSPREIVKRIKDDPAYIRAGAKTRGVSLSQAEKIIDARDKISNKKFTGIDQLYAINGIGDDTVHDILNSFVIKTETQNIDLLFNSTLDLFSHRVDAWISSLAYKRLESMREAKKKGIYLGAYGWVENLKPDYNLHDNEGYIHAPSRGQAATGAVLYNAFLTHRENGNSPYKINLESYRVRKAIQIIDGIRQGQPLGALLGYIFERELNKVKLDKYIDEFRAAFPISVSKTDTPEPDETIEYEDTEEERSSASITARNVVNGLSLIRWDEDNTRKDINMGLKEEVEKIEQIINGTDSGNVNIAIKNLKSSFDAVNDLLLYESVYHTVQGNYDRAAAFMDAMAGKNAIPEIESMKTPLLGNSFENKVCLFFPKPDESELATYISPKSIAGPRLTKWITTLFKPFENIQFSYSYQSFKININQEIFDDNRAGYIEDLQNIPGISNTLAETILEFKQGRTIKDLNELKNIDGIGDRLVKELDRWIYLGKDLSDEPFINLININTATAELLEKLPGIGSVTVEKIMNSRNNEGQFTRIGETIRVEGINKLECNKFRRFCTTGDKHELSLSDLHTDSFGSELSKEIQLQPIDFLYIACITPGGGETEIEKRLKYWIRQEHHLYDKDIIQLQFDKKNNADVSYLEFVQMSQQIIKLLGKASPLRPNEFMLPDEGNQNSYSNEDIQLLSNIETQSFNNLNTISEILAALLTDIENQNPQSIIHELMKASLYGIPVAIPTGSNQEDLLKRVVMTIQAINKKITKYNKYKDSMALPEIVNGIKSLLGNDFIVLPEFITKDPNLLCNIFNQDEILGGLDSDRITLWLQQAALAQSAVNELENTMLLTNALLQTTPDHPHFHWKASQLPYIKGNRWLGLSEDERVLFNVGNWHTHTLNSGEIPDAISNEFNGSDMPLSDAATVYTHATKEWRIIDGDSEYALKVQKNRILVILKSRALSNISIVAGFCGEKIFTETWLDSDKSVSGLKIDAWLETIPNETIDTSVAFHYDAPNTQPPQSLLLAVPPDRNKASWE